MAQGWEPVRFYVDFFLLESNESIPHPGFFFQQDYRQVLAKLKHPDGQERKRNRNVEPKAQLKQINKKREETTRKGNERRRMDKPNKRDIQ